jgi:hypothetical protein
MADADDQRTDEEIRRLTEDNPRRFRAFVPRIA